MTHFMHFRGHRLRSFLDARLQDLNNATCRREDPSQKFIPSARLDDIWTTARLEEFVELARPGFERRLIPEVRDKLLRTLSILVYISWPDWHLFGATFLHHRNLHGMQSRLDDRIPYYNLDSLRAFLDDICADRFLAERWTFFPIVLEEGKTQEYSRDWRLPFVNPHPHTIGSGGYGLVTEEEIAEQQFLASSVLPRAPYQGKLRVARKRYATRADFRQETRTLNYIRSSLLHHKHIVSYLSIVIVGTEHSLLSPLAEMDLERFLGSPPHAVQLPDLIGEARNVVGALGFLHGMLPTNPGQACCHNDLKPANILVFYEPDSTPVGTWKIADFGISVIAAPEEQSTAPVDVTSTVTPNIHNDPPTVQNRPVRNASTYQGPEVCHGGDIGRKSDVWSMGCILVRILALGIDGLMGLGDLDNARGREDVGSHGYYEHDYFHRGSPPRLNPHIKDWLDSLPGRALPDSSAEFWHKLRALLSSMLAIPKRDRPPALEVFQQLNHIEQIVPRNIRVPAHGRRISSTPPSSALSPAGSGSSPSTQTSSVYSQQQLIPVKSVVDAIVSGQMDDLRNLLRCGANVEESHEGDRPLLYAVKRTNTPAVEILHQHNSTLDVESPGLGGETPLAVAAARGGTELVDFLIEKGAPIDGMSAGMTPLMHAARWGHDQTVETLLNQGANCQLYSSVGWTPLHYAVHELGGGDLLNLFVSRINMDRPVDLDVPTDSDEETPLIKLIKAHDGSPQWREKYAALIHGHANVNKQDAYGNSPLLVAMRDDHVELAEDLITRRGAALPPNFSHIPLSHNMQRLVDKAAKSTGQRRHSALSRTTTRFSLSLHRTKS